MKILRVEIHPGERSGEDLERRELLEIMDEVMVVFDRRGLVIFVEWTEGKSVLEDAENRE